MLLTAASLFALSHRDFNIEKTREEKNDFFNWLRLVMVSKVQLSRARSLGSGNNKMELIN